jgi:hypothetical protein
MGAVTLSASTAKLMLNWTSVAGADAYEVYYNTDNTMPGSPPFTVSTNTATINSLINGTIYYVWVKGRNADGANTASVAVSGKPLAAPGTPIIVAGNGQLTVSWTAATGADEYEVFYGIGTPSTLAATVSGTSKIITGLTNGTNYSVAIRGKNTTGSSGISAMSNGKPLATPGAPTITAGNGELGVSWTASAGAEEYEVYYGIGTPSILAATVSETSATITGLGNGTTYSVAIRGKNSTGSSGLSNAVSGKPIPLLGLYDGVIDTAHKLGSFSSLSAVNVFLSSNAITGHSYYIVVGQDESASPINLNYSGKIVTIIITGDTAERKINLTANGVLFTVNAGVTLTLDDKITLIGRSANTSSLVSVNGGTLVLKNGSKISGNTANHGGGVNINSGTFTMNGGEISGNTVSAYYGGGVYVSSGAFTINGGKISGNTAVDGGGVNINSGTFTMNGGEINGNTASSMGGGVYSDGTVTMSGGEISGNTAIQGGGIIVRNSQTFTMSGGKISGNTATGPGNGYGGGLYIQGTFTMNGGEISGNTASTSGGGVNVYSGTFTKTGSSVIYGDTDSIHTTGSTENTVTNGNGHAVYVNSSKKRNSTAGSGVMLDSSQSGSAGGWE